MIPVEVPELVVQIFLELNGDFIFPEYVMRVPILFGGVGMTGFLLNFLFTIANIGKHLRDRRKALCSGDCVRSDPENVLN